MNIDEAKISSLAETVHERDLELQVQKDTAAVLSNQLDDRSKLLSDLQVLDSRTKEIVESLGNAQSEMANQNKIWREQHQEK